MYEIIEQMVHHRNCYERDNYRTKSEFFRPLSHYPLAQKYLYRNINKAFRALLPECDAEDLKQIDPGCGMAIKMYLLLLRRHFKFSLPVIFAVVSKSFNMAIVPLKTAPDDKQTFILHISLNSFGPSVNEHILEQNKLKIRDYISHEVGHLMTYSGCTGREFNRLYPEISLAKPFAGVPGSIYSQTNVREFLAEAFLYLLNGGSMGDFHPVDQTLVHKYIPTTILQTVELAAWDKTLKFDRVTPSHISTMMKRLSLRP